MRTKTKRWIALFLSVCLCVNLMTPAFATGDTEVSSDTIVSQDTSVSDDIIVSQDTNGSGDPNVYNISDDTSLLDDTLLLESNSLLLEGDVLIDTSGNYVIASGDYSNSIIVDGDIEVTLYLNDMTIDLSEGESSEGDKSPISIINGAEVTLSGDGRCCQR